MNLTCSYCQTPFTLGMAEKVAALKRMQSENLHHYDAHCPRCGRANAVSGERLKMFTPGWQDAIKQTASESTPSPSPEARPSTKPEPVSADVPPKKEVKPVPEKPAKKAAKAKPDAKKPVKKPVAKKPKKK